MRKVDVLTHALSETARAHGLLPASHIDRRRRNLYERVTFHGDIDAIEKLEEWWRREYGSTVGISIQHWATREAHYAELTVTLPTRSRAVLNAAVAKAITLNGFTGPYHVTDCD